MGMDFLEKIDSRTNEDLKKVIKEISQKIFGDSDINVTFLDNSDDAVVQILLEQSDEEKKSNKIINDKTQWAMAYVVSGVCEEMTFSINQLQLEFFIPEAQEFIKNEFSESCVEDAEEFKYGYLVEPVSDFNKSENGYEGFDDALYKQAKPYSEIYCSENGTMVCDIYNLRIFYRILCHELYKYNKKKLTFLIPVKNRDYEKFFKRRALTTERLEEFNQSIETQESMLINYVQGRLEYNNISLFEREGIIRFNFRKGINKKFIHLTLPLINNEVHLHFIHPDALYSLALYDVFLNGTYALRELVYLAHTENIKTFLHFNNKEIAQIAQKYTRLDHIKDLKDDIIVFCAEE